MERATDIATGEQTRASTALRQRFRYRCHRCRSFVVPCIGKKRHYFRHEQGAAWCPEMAEENAEGAGSSTCTRPLRRLILDENDDWSVKDTKLNVISLYCDLLGQSSECHVHDVASMTETRATFFLQPGFGGMQLADRSHFYANEPHFFLKEPQFSDLAEELRAAARPHGEPRNGQQLLRVAPLDEWEGETDNWLVSVGLRPNLRSRYRWQIEDDLANLVVHSGQALSALLATRPFRGHHLELFASTSTRADWLINTNAKGTVLIDCQLSGRASGEFYARFESTLDLTGAWRENDWAKSGGKRTRSLELTIGRQHEMRVNISTPA